MKLVFMSQVDKASLWEKHLKAELPELEFSIWPEGTENPDEVDYVLAWKPPAGEIAKFKNLKAILSLGAGVDGIVCDPDLPKNVPISRLVDRCLTQGMAEYITYWVLHHHRRMGDYAASMADKNWINYLQADTEERNIGILGLGELGSDAARALTAFNFKVSGWSRSSKTRDGVTCFFGADGLKEIIAQSEILICLLPLTDETESILNTDLFAQMPENSVLINCARGAHLVDDDLITALDSGHLSAAVLDVFHVEPPNPNHPFWDHPKITMTPHMASLTVPSSAALYIADNIRRVERGELPLNLLDLDKGY